MVDQRGLPPPPARTTARPTKRPMPDNETLLRFMITITITKTARKTKSFLQNGK